MFLDLHALWNCKLLVLYKPFKGDLPKTIFPFSDQIYSVQFIIIFSVSCFHCSGLDSTSSLTVLNALRKVAEGGKLTVACVIHQPRYEIFSKHVEFSKLCLLLNEYVGSTEIFNACGLQ